jgi:predicted peroxiredoxin
MDIRRLKTAGMKFMICTAGYSLLDHRRNEDVYKNLEVDPVKNKLAQYKQKLFKCVNRMEEDIRYPELLVSY